MTLSSNIEIQRKSLIDFYHSTNGSYWNDNDNWLTNKSLSLWYGITTNDNGEVINLFLPSNNLNGVIPESIGIITTMESFFLSYNLMLTGSIPESFKSMNSLLEFRCDDCSLTGKLLIILSYLYYISIHTGSIPSFIYSLSNLTTLQISACFLTGSIQPLINLINLNSLSLQKLYLTGTIPELYLPNLRTISFTGNYLTGLLPIGDYVGKYYYLSKNYLYGTIPDGYLVNDIISIELNDNILSGSLIDVIPSMSRIYIQSNKLSGSIPNGFINEIIYDLRLFSNLLTGIIPNMLNSSINFLYLEDNYLSGAIESDIFWTNSTIIISVNNNMLSGSVCDNCLKFQSILSINLGGNYFTGNVLCKTEVFSELVDDISLYDNFFTGELVELFNNLVLIGNSLSQLIINDNYSGSIPSTVANLLSLASLYLGSNLIYGTLPNLCPLESLRLLDITNINLCYPTCISRAVLGASSGVLHRCQDLQDISICSLVNSEPFLSTVGSVGNIKSLTYESAHLYNPNEAYSTIVSIEGASSYEVIFDEWSHTEEEYDYITFSSPNKQQWIHFSGINFPGMNGNDPLILPYDEFDLYFDSDGKIEYWGYSMTVSATIPHVGWVCTTPPDIAIPYDSSVLSQYNLTLNNSYAVDFCGNDNLWEGITCTHGIVTSLSFGSYGISGTLPSVIGLLTGLEELLFSYNSITGTIPDSYGDLVKIKTLDLSNNRLQGTIPYSFGRLTVIENLNLNLNTLIGTLPESLALTNQSLKSLILSVNSLSGKLENSLCSLVNSSVDVAGNRLVCYESCWLNARDLKIGSVELCSPTGYPTILPTSPTSSPTKFKTSTSMMSLNIVIVTVLVSFVISSVLSIRYYYLNSVSKNFLRKKLELKNKILKQLPVHRMIIEKSSSRMILKAIKDIKDSIYLFDYDGCTAMDLAIKYDCNDEVIVELLLHFLPINIESMSATSIQSHKRAWMNIIQIEKYFKVIDRVLEMHFNSVHLLAYIKDSVGRPAINLASPLNFKVIKSHLYFMRRYDISEDAIPHHKSATSLIYIAYDDESNQRVAIKLMSNSDSYYREVNSRRINELDDKYVVSILTNYDKRSDVMFHKEIERRGWSQYHYCIIMLAADRNLEVILSSEHIAGKEWQQIKLLTWQLASALDHIHSKGLVHGDVKPMNIMRVGDRVKLIDLDSSSLINSISTGSKVSSAYIPPEMLYLDDLKYVMIRNSSPNSSDHIRMYPSFDSWSFGIVLYQLFSGFSFYITNDEDNIDPFSLERLYKFSDEFKNVKLQKIVNMEARNLVSQLLSTNSNTRLTMKQVMSHVFISGKQCPRILCEKAEFDIFISYRRESDFTIAKLYYEYLTVQGYRIWWDHTCVKAGESWELSISMGLMKSRIFIPIISRNSLNHSSNPLSNICMLRKDSPNDYVILEYTIALELHSRGYIENIYPIFVGDIIDSPSGDIIGDYFIQQCDPKIADVVVVDSIDRVFRKCLDKMCLGSPILIDRSILNVKDEILQFNGHVVTGKLSDNLELIFINLDNL